MSHLRLQSLDQSEKREVARDILRGKAFPTLRAGRTAHAHTELNKLLGDTESAGPLALEVIQFRISFPRGKPRWNESLKVSSFRISWLWSPGIYSASPFCVPHSSPSPPLIARMSLCPGSPEGWGSVRWEAPELPSPAQPDAKTCGLALPQPGTPPAGFESSAGSARPLLKKGGRRNPRDGLWPRCRLPWQPVPSPAVTLRWRKAAGTEKEIGASGGGFARREDKGAARGGPAGLSALRAVSVPSASPAPQRRSISGRLPRKVSAVGLDVPPRLILRTEPLWNGGWRRGIAWPPWPPLARWMWQGRAPQTQLPGAIAGPQPSLRNWEADGGSGYCRNRQARLPALPKFRKGTPARSGFSHKTGLSRHLPWRVGPPQLFHKKVGG